jgi:GNAT superfamily N-acetyltransferase
MEFHVREYRHGDAGALRRCVVALQEFERGIDPHLPAGEEMADAWCARLHARCAAADGRIFVAETGGIVAGFVAVMAREPFTEPDDPAGTCALLNDLVVLEEYRGRGIGRELVRHAEAFARERGARELRLQVLARNAAARALYEEAGFGPYLEVLVKRW